MAYTEIKKRKEKKYYYRVISIRNGKKVSKKRIYLGSNLKKDSLRIKEIEADKKLNNEKISKSIKPIKQKIINIIKKTGIKRAGIFGSFARGESKKSSDIDILVEPTKKMSYFEIIQLEEKLKNALNRKIDLVTYKSIHPLLKEKILNEEVKLI